MNHPVLPLGHRPTQRLLPAPFGRAAHALLAAGCLVAAGCGGDAEPAASGDSGRVESPHRTMVEVRTIAPATLTDVLEISGRLEPRAEFEVAAELGGRVEEVHFDKGDVVAAGQLLTRVGSDLLQAALAEEEADLEAEEVALARTRQLVEREAAPEQDLDSAVADRNRAAARVETARLRLGRAEIAAPAAGIVVERLIEPGEILAPGSGVATLHDTAVLRATIGIPENDIALFSVGAPAEVVLDAYGDRAVAGEIVYIAPSATRPGRNFLAEVEVPNPTGELRSGLIVRARLQRRVFEDAVVVARDALVERDGALLAFVLEAGGSGEGHAVAREVQVGPDEGNRVVVLSGLGVGETLLVRGHRNLLDGEPVRVAPARTD